MQVTRRSPLTGKINTMEVNATQEQMDEFYSPNRERLIQEIFCDASAEGREFILTGYTEEDWDHMWQEEAEYSFATCTTLKISFL